MCRAHRAHRAVSSLNVFSLSPRPAGARPTCWGGGGGYWTKLIAVRPPILQLSCPAHQGMLSRLERPDRVVAVGRKHWINRLCGSAAENATCSAHLVRTVHSIERGRCHVPSLSVDVKQHLKKFRPGPSLIAMNRLGAAVYGLDWCVWTGLVCMTCGWCVWTGLVCMSCGWCDLVLMYVVCD